MSHDDPHSLLDDQMRSVPLPAGMLARLRSIPEVGSDEVTDHDLDEMLATVRVPLSMTLRLHDLLADEVLDGRLRDVDLPVRVLARARIISRQRSRARVVAMAGATALLMLMMVGYLGMLGGVLWGIRTDEPMVAKFVYDGPLQMNGKLATVRMVAPPRVAPVSARPVLSQEDVRPVEVPEFATTPRGLLVDWQQELDRGLDPWQDVMLLKWDVLGAPPSTEPLAMRTVSFPAAKGLSLPLARGYDRQFLNVQGIHPPMFLGVNPQLRRAALPLTTATDSYLRLQAKLAGGRDVEAESIRVEEFLAALEYRFPPPKKEALGIRVAAGPALFGDGRSQIVQVGVKAKSQPPRSSPPTHLVIALDASQSMGWDDRWQAVQAGLRSVLAQLGPNDRLSLVGFNESIVLEVEDANQHDFQQVLRAVSNLRPLGGSSVSRGLARCASMANQAAMSTRSVQLVLVTDGDQLVNADTLPPLAGMLADLAERDVRLQILQLGRAGPRADLENLAAAAETRVAAVADGEQLSDRLLTMLLGSSAKVACDVSARVTFNPKAVAAYRLLGHEANAIAMVEPTVLRTDFAANAEAVGLYEVWLRPGDAMELGRVEVTWRDPKTGRQHRKRQRVSRLQLATSWEECALSLQLAQLVAETADVLRGGYRFEWIGDGETQAKRKPRTLRHVLEALRYTHPALLERAEVSDFVRMLENLSHGDLRANR